MMVPRFLSNPSTPLVIDASVCINLNATRVAERIFDAIPNEVRIVDFVYRELANGISSGRDDAERTLALVRSGTLRIVELGEVGLARFERLVSGSANQTLDDGEAATIACALESDAIALIDERKATRVCAETYGWLPVVSTVDLFAHPEVKKTLGVEGLAQAVFDALQIARMNVQVRNLKWVINLIGPERAVLCNSLSGSVRSSLAEFDTSPGE